MNKKLKRSVHGLLCRLLPVALLLGMATREISAVDTHAHTRGYGIGEGYDPDSPGDPQPPQPAPTTYTLTVVNNPVDAGTCNRTTEKWEEGQQIYLYAYPNGGFEFVNWTIDGESYSDSRAAYYTMPAHDVVIVANYVFNPESPGDPDPVEQKVKHPVTLRSEPTGSASFNQSSIFSLEEGEQRYIRVYPVEGWEIVNWTVNGELSGENMPEVCVTMGEEALDIVAHMKYNPVVPGNPGSNYYNPSTGEVIIDDFRPGGFYSTLYNVLGGYYLADVSSLVAKGEMNWDDSGYIGAFENASLLDFSRIGGLTGLRPYSFSLENLETLLLPSCLSEIEYYAFYNVPNLKSITLYASVPPKVNNLSFYGIPDRGNCILYVPAESIPLYADADFWKDFVILPISADTRVLQVNLPEDATDGRYKNNVLQVVNVRSGVKQRYVVSDRLLYTFNDLQSGETYSIYLFSQSGLELGRIENVEIPEEDIAVTFDSLKSLFTLSAKVMDAENNDVTDSVIVEWLKAAADGSLTYIKKAVNLEEVPEGEELICRVTLDSKLGSIYAMPDDAHFIAGPDGGICMVQLQPFSSVTVSGKVAGISGNGINGATVSATQTLNGSFPKTTVAKTDRKGIWTMALFDTPQTVLTYSAPECVNATDTIGNLPVSEATVDLGTKVLKSIVGARINYSLTYHAAGEEPRDYIDEDKDLAIEVYNVTRNRAHSEVSLQYPEVVVLDENIQEGDELRLTLSSRSGAFNPIVKNVNIDDRQRASATFDIIGKGGISARYSMSENPGVEAVLYNKNGDLVRKQAYQEAKTVITGLEDGEYSLVTIGSSSLMGSLLRISGFEEIGLREGTDYVKSPVKVESGVLTEVAIDQVPLLDESQFYYTTSTSGFTSNKSEVTTGNYLTLRASIDFKGIYKDEIEDVTLMVDLPQTSELVAQSVIQGTGQKPYTMDGSRLTIPLGDKYREQVRFCVIPTAGGEFASTAYLSFSYNGKIVTQPLGTVTSTIKDLGITVPSITASLTFIATGSAPAKSEVEVISDGAIIGKAIANGTGRWSTECELPEATKLGSVFVSAKITTPAGLTLTTEEKEIQYDVDAIIPAEVVMTFYNGWYKRQYEVKWNLIDATSSTNKYDFYATTDLTFLVKFTDNDPEKLRNIVLNVFTSDGKVRKLIPVFSSDKKCWVATGTFTNAALPTNVSVDYEMTQSPKFDSDFMAEYLDLNSVINDLYGDKQEWLDSIQERLANATDDERAAILAEFIAECGVEWSETEDEGLNEEIILQHLQSMEEDPEWLSNLLSASPFGADLSKYMDGVSFTRCEGLSAASLLAEGYSEIPKSDGNSSYYKLTDNVFVFVDFENDACLTVDLNSNSVLARSLRAARADENDRGWLKDIKELSETIKTTVQGVYDFFNECSDRLVKLILEYEQDMGMLSRDLDWLNHNNGSWFMKAELEAKLFLKGKAQQGLMAMKDWLDTNVKQWMQGSSKASKIAGKAFSFSALILDGVEAYKNMNRLYDLRDAINPPCEAANQYADGLRTNANEWIRGSGAYYTYKLGADIAELIGMGSAISALIPSGGTSITVILASAAVVAINIAADVIYSNSLEGFIDRTKKSVKLMEELCKKKDTKPEDFPKPGDDLYPNNNGNTDPNHYPTPTPPGCNPVNPILDPSGYVYEAVPENRVEGVRATIYYKEMKEDMYGDPYEEIVLWNAEEYAQKNPLFTDEYGMYQWDVPQGLWQVKFEKDGYVTAYSEWLPVPPPQLDVNVAITQNKQPEVVEARAYEEGIEVQFDKFMDQATLTGSNIFVTANNEKVAGRISLLDSSLADEYADEADAEARRYTSRIRFVPELPLSATTGEIRLTVNRNVLSYAGIPMTENYTQVLDVEKEIQAIAAEDVKVLYGGEKEITIFALPYEAAIGRTVKITSSSDLILSLDKDEALFDDEGKAVVTVRGDLPGQAQLSFSVEGVTATGECLVEVVTEITEVEAPKASRASGTALYRGTEIELFVDNNDAVIYYTFDGTCPCDEDGTRRRYSAPIVITDDVKILAMAMVGDEASDVAEFNYTIRRNDVEYTLPQGWSWISHTLETPVETTVFTADENILRILGQNGEVVRDAENGLVGNLTSLEAAQSYKVETTAPVSNLRISDAAFNPASPIMVKNGWNWLGYPLTQTMTPDEAFASTSVDLMDVVIGQHGFAQYDGDKWVGTLETLSPGVGYIYVSGKDKEVVYNTSIVSVAGAQAANGITPVTDYVVDVHKYPSVMPMVATLLSLEEEKLDNSLYQVYAFSGSECRGIGRLVDGKIMMNIYGSPDDEISFYIADSDGDGQYPAVQKEKFADNMLGSIAEPYSLAVNFDSKVSSLGTSGKVKVQVEDDMLRISGIDASEIDYVELYDLDGRKRLHASNISESGIRLPSLISGVYIVLISGNGNFTYHKISIP